MSELYRPAFSKNSKKGIWSFLIHFLAVANFYHLFFSQTTVSNLQKKAQGYFLEKLTISQCFKIDQKDLVIILENETKGHFEMLLIWSL